MSRGASSDLRARDLRELLLPGSASLRVRAAAEECWTGGTRTAPSGSSGSSATRRRGRLRRASARDPDEVAVTTSVSQAVSAFVSALDFTGERNRIVISDYEFPTVGQIAHAQALRGAEVVRVLASPTGRFPPERFAQSVDERTAPVCCTTVSFRPGHRHDGSSIAEVAHASGALVLADSYQAVGALELDVRSLGADVVTGGTVKYLLGSAGLAFMWVQRVAVRLTSAHRPAGSRTRTSSDVDRRLLATCDGARSTAAHRRSLPCTRASPVFRSLPRPVCPRSRRTSARSSTGSRASTSSVRPYNTAR